MPNNPRGFSPIILLLIILLILGASFGGYTVYNQYFMSPSKNLIRASEKFTKLKSVHAEGEMNISVSEYSEEKKSNEQFNIKMDFFGDFDVKNNNQKLHMKQSIDLKNDQKYTIESDLVMLGGKTQYMKSAMFGDKWLKVDLEKKNATESAELSSNDFLAQSKGVFDSFDKNSILKLEDEVIDGIKTTHYRIDVSTDKYIEALKKSTKDEKQVESFKDAAIKTDMWIDIKTNNIVRMKLEVKNFKSQETSGDMNMVFNYSKFDQPVNIGKPDGEVVDYEEFIKQQQEQTAKNQQATQSQTPKQSDKQVTAPTQNCQNLNIREGEFASNKCYYSKDLEDLKYYISASNNAIFNSNAASNSMSVTCSGSDFFAAQCEQDKKDKEAAEADVNKYRGIIQGLIAKGR